jgi:hypothetical protein
LTREINPDLGSDKVFMELKPGAVRLSAINAKTEEALLGQIAVPEARLPIQPAFSIELTNVEETQLLISSKSDQASPTGYASRAAK